MPYPKPNRRSILKLCFKMIYWRYWRFGRRPQGGKHG